MFICVHELSRGEGKRRRRGWRMEGGRWRGKDGVAQLAEESVVAYVVFGLEDGVPQAFLFMLVDGADGYLFQQHIDGGEEVGFVGGAQAIFQGGISCEVIFYGALVRAGNQQDVGDAGGGGFFYDVLNRGAVEDGEGFLGEGFGRGKHG